jgi:hypothetical protein
MMKNLELTVVISGSTHTSDQIAAAIRTLLVWAEPDADTIRVSDATDSSISYYAEKDTTERLYEAGV